MSNKYIINDNVWSDTDLVSPVPIEAPEIEFIFDRYDFRRIKQKYAQRLDSYNRAILGSKNLKYNNAILISESIPTNLNGGVVSFVREYVEVPDTTEEIVPISYTYPSLWTPLRYREIRNTSGDFEIEEIKYNLARPPLTTNTSARIIYTYFTVTPDTQTSINREDNLAEYMDIETNRKDPIASLQTIRGINSFSVDYIDGTTLPNYSQYIQAISSASDRYIFRAYDTVIEQWIANIYRKKDVFIQPR